MLPPKRWNHRQGNTDVNRPAFGLTRALDIASMEPLLVTNVTATGLKEGLRAHDYDQERAEPLTKLLEEQADRIAKRVLM